jgi:hypothetical protein
MKPNAEEVVRGVQAGLLSLVLPELQTEYVRTQVTLMYVLLGIVANGMDTSYERLLADNSALRELAARAAEAVEAQHVLANELRSLASTEASLRLNELSSSNIALAAALARVAASDGSELTALRAEIMSWLRADAEARSLSLMGPRADG